MGEFARRLILMVGEGPFDADRISYLGRVADITVEAGKEFEAALDSGKIHDIIEVYKKWFEKE